MIYDRIDKKRTKLIGALLKQWSTFEASVFGSRPLLDLLVVVLVVALPVCKNLRTYVEEITKCAQVENTEQQIRNFCVLRFQPTIRNCKIKYLLSYTYVHNFKSNNWMFGSQRGIWHDSKESCCTPWGRRKIEDKRSSKITKKAPMSFFLFRLIYHDLW